MDDKQRIALIETTTTDTSVPAVTLPSATTRYQFSNHLGTACLELDETAAVISYEEYYPYGSTSYQAGLTVAEVSLKRYRYTGKERDEESGLYYHGARYYAPWIGRWTSCDPMGMVEGPNFYLYAAASPVCMADRNGMQASNPHPEDTDIHQVWKEGPASDGGSAPDKSSTTVPPASGKSTKASSSSVGDTIKHAALSVGKWFKHAASSIGKWLQHAAAAVGKFFEKVAGGIHSIANWMRDWLPGLVAAPLAGIVDTLAGFSRLLGSAFSGKGKTAVQGLKDMGLGLLSMVGLKQVVEEKWISPEEVDVHTTTLKMPRTMAKDIKEASDIQKRLAPDAWKNGMHAWHAATNAHVVNRLGPVAAPLLWLAGVIHESPIDWGSFMSEQKAQGTVNHILDSSTDILANAWGILLGMVLPRKIAVKAGAITGNYIPGPGDPDPEGVGKGGYKGRPQDAWGQYP